jgi:hypothetical protein
MVVFNKEFSNLINGVIGDVDYGFISQLGYDLRCSKKCIVIFASASHKSGQQ